MAKCDPVKIDLNDKPSLQRGARLFVNYCLSCHSASYMRYNRVGQDLGISEELVEKIAKYFHYDRDRLLIAAGKIPPEVLRILQDHPDEALGFLRERFARVDK